MDLMEEHRECTMAGRWRGWGSEDWKKGDERRGTERLHFIFPWPSCTKIHMPHPCPV